MMPQDKHMASPRAPTEGDVLFCFGAHERNKHDYCDECEGL